MCDTCGCGQGKATILKPGEENSKNHGKTTHTHDGETHTHDHSHSHDHSHPRKVKIEQDVLGKNNLLAERNRGFFQAKNILALNLVSSPGSGKTSLLERTIKEKGKELTFFIIEGDQQTMNDANRIAKVGAPVVQVNTGEGCHLDADMVNRAVQRLEVADKAVLMIENVGNLVCPAMFDLGESSRVVIISTTEGEDKPLKYPYMFRSSNLCIINKTDLLPYLDFDVEKAREYALQINPDLKIIELSVKSGEGMDQWYDWLKQEMKD
ncbi:MAG TPA: hydrogenase accessory protein HypB [Bacteroides sp.]|nr:hydrogenase accessory protein HypB [Bacteroides sp.]